MFLNAAFLLYLHDAVIYISLLAPLIRFLHGNTMLSKCLIFFFHGPIRSDDQPPVPHIVSIFSIQRDPVFPSWFALWFALCLIIVVNINISFVVSFEADAEERCKHHLDEAIKKDSSNPEAFHLLASFFLSKDETEVSESHDSSVEVIFLRWLGFCLGNIDM